MSDLTSLFILLVLVLVLVLTLLDHTQYCGMHRTTPKARTLVLRIVLAAVLQVLPQQIAADGCNDLLDLTLRDFERYVAARFKRDITAQN